MSIYDTDKVRLPSVVLPRWKRDKLYHYLEVFGINYHDFIDEVIYELHVSWGTGCPEHANHHKDIHEAIGRVVDRLIDRNALEGRVPNQPPPEVFRRSYPPE